MTNRNRTQNLNHAGVLDNIHDVRAMLAYVSTANHENTGDELDLGRYLILSHCRDKLHATAKELESKPSLEVVRA
jgi:hypothetical protein